MDRTRSALIIASEQYTDPGLRALRAPASDAQALAAVLRDPDIGGFEVRTLLDEPAHVVNLTVEEFFADRQPGDLLLVHFSGHGIKDQNGELYFAASNTVLGRLGATAVAAEFVNRLMSRSRSRRVVLLLDCCYAGAFERGLVARAGPELGIAQQLGGRGRAVITASSAMEYAFEAGGPPMPSMCRRRCSPAPWFRGCRPATPTGTRMAWWDWTSCTTTFTTRSGRSPRVRRPASGPSAWKGSCTSPAAAARSPRPRRCHPNCGRRSTARWLGSGAGRSRNSQRYCAAATRGERWPPGSPWNSSPATTAAGSPPPPPQR